MRAAASIIIVASVALGLLSGCGKTPPESGPGLRFPAAGAYPDRPADRAIDMITRSGDYPVRRHALDVAEMALAEKCMRDAGVPWSGGVDELNPDEKDGSSVSLDYIRRHGYGLSDGTPAAMDPGRADPTMAPADDERLRSALLGPADDRAQLTIPGIAGYGYPRRGCLAQAHAAVYGDLTTWALIFYLPQELNLTANHQAMADDRYTAAVRRWHDCMRRRGYSYAAPGDIPEALTKAYRTTSRPQPIAQRRQVEVALALQDAACRRQVGLDTTRLALRREYAARIEPPLGREMNRLAALFDAAEQRIAASG